MSSVTITELKENEYHGTTFDRVSTASSGLKTAEIWWIARNEDNYKCTVFPDGLVTWKRYADDGKIYDIEYGIYFEPVPFSADDADLIADEMYSSYIDPDYDYTEELYDDLFVMPAKKTGKTGTKNIIRMQEKLRRDYFGHWRHQSVDDDERRFTISFRKIMQSVSNNSKHIDDSKRSWHKTDDRRFRMRWSECDLYN